MFSVKAETGLFYTWGVLPVITHNNTPQAPPGLSWSAIDRQRHEFPLTALLPLLTQQPSRNRAGYVLAVTSRQGNEYTQDQYKNSKETLTGHIYEPLTGQI